MPDVNPVLSQEELEEMRERHRLVTHSACCAEINRLLRHAEALQDERDAALSSADGAFKDIEQLQRTYINASNAEKARRCDLEAAQKRAERLAEALRKIRNALPVKRALEYQQIADFRNIARAALEDTGNGE